MVDPLFHDRHRLEQDADVAQRLWNLVQEARRLDVVLRHEAVAPHDAALGVPTAAAHVVLASLALRAESTRAPYGRYDEVAGGETRHATAHVLDDAEVLVTENQEFLAIRRLAEHAVIDFGVGRAEADPQHLHGDLVRLHPRIRHLP